MDDDPTRLWTDPARELASELDLEFHRDYLVATDPAAVRRLRALSGSLSPRTSERLLVESRHGSATTRFGVPIRSGARVIVRRAWGTYDLVDYEVEIAHAAAAANPATEPVYDGIFVTALIGSGRSRIPIELGGRIRALGDLVETQLGGGRLGKLFRHESTVFPFDIRRDLEWGNTLRIPLAEEVGGGLARSVSVSLQGGDR